MKINKPVTICVKRRAAIGDVIMTTGVVRELKKLYGETAHIVVATDKLSVYQNNPNVLGVISYDEAEKLTWEVHWKLQDLNTGEGSGIPSVGVKSVDIRRNTGGEGGYLDRY